MIYRLRNKFLLFFLILLSFNFINTNSIFAFNTYDSSIKLANSEVTDSSSYANVKSVTTKSTACILMDAKSGKILYSKNANKALYPASTTKLMTAILTLEKCKLTDVATVSHNAIFSIPVGYSHASLREGEQLTIEQLLNVLLIPSANDAAIVLAEHIAGSVDNFSKLMNDKAKEIGCKNTNFVNPNGIHNKNHYSSAYDMALIGKYALNFPDIKRIAMTKQYTLPQTNKYNKTDRIFNSTNVLINNESGNKNYYPYATGLKTGYTGSAGYCIVSTAKKNNMELIAVTLKAKSISDRCNDCKSLFNYGFENYSYKTLQSVGNIVKTIEIENATKETKYLDIAIKDSITVLVPNSIDVNNLEYTIELEPNLKAPIPENKIVGKITYVIDGEKFTSDLFANSSVISSNISAIIFKILLVIIILYIIYILLKSKPKKKNSRKKNDKINGYNIRKKNKKISNKKSRYKKSHICGDDIHSIHNGTGEIKFKQLHDFL